MDVMDKKENLYKDRLLPPRKVPRPQLKRGQSHEDNNLDPEFGLNSCDYSKVPKIQNFRVTSEH